MAVLVRVPSTPSAGPCVALGQQDGAGHGRQPGQGSAVRLGHPQGPPGGHGLLHIRPGQGPVEALGQAHLPAPGLAAPPAQFVQVIGGGGEGVGQGAPEVLAAVSVPVHRVGLIGGGHELHVAHGSGPGALHGSRRDVPPLEDVQGVQQLGAKERPAAVVVGQGGQGGGYGVAAQVLAVVGLQAPEGHQHAGRDSILPGDAL
jgi:hypothetical protein